MKTFSAIKDTESKEPLIWSISIKWFDVDWVDDRNPNGQYNTLCFSNLPTEASEDEIRSVTVDEFDAYLKRKEKSPSQDTEITIENRGRHRWWLTWFAHETNQKLTKDDAFRDFAEFVCENRFSRYDLAPDSEKYSEFIWCPMGAEDSGRWKACECDECKKSEYVTRIIH